MTQMNLPTKEKQTHRHREPTCGCQGGGGGGGMDWEFGISRCKLIYRMDRQQGPTIYSTRNCIQSPVINHYGKGYKKVYMYN